MLQQKSTGIGHEAGPGRAKWRFLGRESHCRDREDGFGGRVFSVADVEGKFGRFGGRREWMRRGTWKCFADRYDANLTENKILWERENVENWFDSRAANLISRSRCAMHLTLAFRKARGLQGQQGF
jgi:hypothetical protein